MAGCCGDDGAPMNSQTAMLLGAFNLSIDTVSHRFDQIAAAEKNPARAADAARDWFLKAGSMHAEPVALAVFADVWARWSAGHPEYFADAERVD